ncbi:ATP-dependent DNA helicase Q1 [Paramuricea clavata]|uniref:DNA 3'-5' helicase n=1 Tax=Paramuricea clavata TaxID=317549 RepID=A0A7D9DCD5_PARCT|nr:ATP-dependent DNA helicase Q1 [Paramuricea clavata]
MIQLLIIVDNAVLVISPLNSLINDQITILQNRGVDAVVLNTSLVGDAELRGNTTENDGDEEHVINKSKFGIDTASQERLEKRKFNLVYAHPESFISCKEGRQLLMSSTFQEKISTIVIDEAHLVAEWGREFRKDYGKLSQLTSLFPYSPVLLLTATAPNQTREALIANLSLKDPRIIIANLNRKNIYIEKSKRLASSLGEESYHSILLSIAKDLKQQLVNYPLTIIYNPLKWCGYAYKLFLDVIGEESFHPKRIAEPKNCLFAQYHSPQTDERKREILSQLQGSDKSKVPRVVFATVAIGMGVHISDVRQVIHIGPPRTLEAYYQEIGRAGRDGEPARATLYYNGHDIASNKPGMTDEMRDFCHEETVCLRDIILKHLGSPMMTTFSCVKHCCCTNCSKQCQCTSCKSTQPKIAMQEQAVPQLEARKAQRQLSNGQRDTINLVMREYRMKLAQVGYCINGIDASTGVTLELIDAIVENCEFLTSSSDLFSSYEIWDIKHAEDLFAIIVNICGQ